MRLNKWHLKTVVILAGLAWTGANQHAMAGSREPNAVITIHIYNYAKVSRDALNEAEQVTAKIFRNAGLKIQWVDESENSKVTEENPADPSLRRTHFHLKILSYGMSDRLALHEDVMGLAPGSGADRDMIYVCYSRVQDLAATQLQEHILGTVGRPAHLGQLLGATIAHELGHVLNLPEHSQTGIMRGRWDSNDFRALTFGSLLFTSAQAEVIRADFARRNSSVSLPSTQPMQIQEPESVIAVHVNESQCFTSALIGKGNLNFIFCRSILPIPLVPLTLDNQSVLYLRSTHVQAWTVAVAPESPGRSLS